MAQVIVYSKKKKTLHVTGGQSQVMTEECGHFGQEVDFHQQMTGGSVLAWILQISDRG